MSIEKSVCKKKIKIAYNENTSCFAFLHQKRHALKQGMTFFRLFACLSIFSVKYIQTNNFTCLYIFYRIFQLQDVRTNCQELCRPDVLNLREYLCFGHCVSLPLSLLYHSQTQKSIVLIHKMSLILSQK